MIKPNLIFSHNWHVQPNCQRSLRALRLSGALLDRGPAVTPGCPRTCCAGQFRVLQRSLAFLREPSKHIEDPLPCQAFNFHSLEAAPTPYWWHPLACESLVGPTGTRVPFRNVAQRKISNINPTEPLGLTGVLSWVLQWLVLVYPLRESLQSFRGFCLT